MRRRLTAVIVCSTALAGCIGTTGVPVVPGSPPPSVAPVVRSILAAGQPAVAADRNLELVRYTIQPGTRLPAHRHPGLQLAYVESGELSYTVIEGTVTVHGTDGGTRTIGAARTGTIVAGEWIAEDETVVHYGENAGSEPLVILASSLLDAAQPPAVLVPSPSAP